MKLGDWDLAACSMGAFGLDGGAMFGVVPKAIWGRNLPPDELNRIPMVMRTLVARGHGRTVIVDVGAGTGYTDKLRKIYDFKGESDARKALDSAGVPNESVTDVLLTHLHFDHAAGLAVPAAGGYELAFPDARHHVQKSQYEHAKRPNPRDRASYFDDRLSLMEREGVLEIHEGDWTLAQGFDLVVVDGHTPGQQLPRVSGEERTLFFCGDLIPTRHHIPTPYIMSYDLDPVLAMKEKAAVVERASVEGWILFFEHDAHVAACRVARDGNHFGAGEEIEI